MKTKKQKTDNEITITEWLSEIEKYSKALDSDAQGGLTLIELSEAWDLSTQSVKKRLRSAQASGWLVNAMGKRLSIDGRMRPCPVYSFAKPKDGHG